MEETNIEETTTNTNLENLLRGASVIEITNNDLPGIVGSLLHLDKYLFKKGGARFKTIVFTEEVAELVGSREGVVMRKTDDSFVVQNFVGKTYKFQNNNVCITAYQDPVTEKYFWLQGDTYKTN